MRDVIPNFGVGILKGLLLQLFLKAGTCINTCETDLVRQTCFTLSPGRSAASVGKVLFRI